MKKLILLNICLLFSTLTLAIPSKQQDDINIVVRPAIYGLWGMKIPGHQCIEYYNFKNNGQTVIHSAKEWSTGVYEYQPSNENKKIGALALQIKYDNNEKDCSNQQINQTGEVSQYFVHWKDDNNIQFCDSAEGNKCFADLKRVLP